MNTLTHSSVFLITPNAYGNQNSLLLIANGLSSSSFPLIPKSRTTEKFSVPRSKSVILCAKRKNDEKEDRHSFIAKPDEAIGPFPEAVLLKEKKVEKDGKLVPEFADAEEENLYESLNLQLQSKLDVESMRHYEVVYLVHEKHADEVGNVSEKVQDFVREKRGRLWRLSDWGMRRLAYKIQKAKNAHYILMNFEIEAKWINDFKSMLDSDERVIRHLVIKRDKAITEDCPPPPEFHTIRGGMDDGGGDEEEEDGDIEYDDEDYDEDLEGDNYDDDTEDGIIIVNSDGEDGDDKSNNLSRLSKAGISKQRAQKISR